MNKNKKVVTGLLLVMTFVLLAATIYISTLLSSSNSPTQIQKTKASAVTYTKTVDLAEFGEEGSEAPSEEAGPSPTVEPAPTEEVQIEPTIEPTKAANLVAQAPTRIPTSIPTQAPTVAPTDIVEPTEEPTPTLSPLLAYKSTGGVTPTLFPIGQTGGMESISPTKKVAPTKAPALPEAGWVQTSTILFIVATSTILISLLF